MNKIIAGIVGLILVTGVTATAARALFTSQAQVAGISITSGDAGLQVHNGSGFVSTWSTGLSLTNVYPGFQDDTTLRLKNASNAVINLAVTGQLTGATNWPALSEAVEVAVNAADNSSGTGWHTLAEWNAGAIAFPGAPLTQLEERDFNVFVRVPTVYAVGTTNAGNPVGNEIAGLSLTDITFTLTGTQTP